MRKENPNYVTNDSPYPTWEQNQVHVIRTWAYAQRVGVFNPVQSLLRVKNS
jgi:hypothetical protein